MVDFWERKSDVLVCTTIVEAGLDISTANTLLIERADLLGLSQLHQLRGRVGRSPGARVRLLLLPAGQAADRDRVRPAGHHRRPRRPGRRHGGGHEGPGDPRGRQPARRRAVRSHRRRRLRPLHPAGRRGGRRVPRRGHRAGARDPDRAAGRRAPAGRLRLVGAAAAGDVQAAGRGPLAGRHRRGRRGAHRSLRGAARPGTQPAGGGGVPAAGPAGRADRDRHLGQLHPVRAGGAARVPGAAAEAALPRQRGEGRGQADLGAAAARRRHRRGPAPGRRAR